MIQTETAAKYTIPWHLLSSSGKKEVLQTYKHWVDWVHFVRSAPVTDAARVTDWLASLCKVIFSPADKGRFSVCFFSCSLSSKSMSRHSYANCNMRVKPQTLTWPTFCSTVETCYFVRWKLLISKSETQEFGFLCRDSIKIQSFQSNNVQPICATQYFCSFYKTEQNTNTLEKDRFI